jgi:hypothetical protein
MTVAGAAGVILYLLVTVVERFAVPWDPSIRAPRR